MGQITFLGVSLSTWILNFLQTITVSTAVSYLVLRENIRKRNVETITLNRMEWLKEVRRLLSEFAIAYRLTPEDTSALIKIQVQLLMYFRQDKEHYNLIVNQIETCCTIGKYDEVEYKKLILLSQRELARVWERMKAECVENISPSEDDRILDYVNDNTKDLLSKYKALDSGNAHQ